MRMEKKEAVSPVIAVILMVAITVVLAAVLFVMVQNIGVGDTDLTAMSMTKAEQADGWLITVAKGEVTITASVSYYLLTPQGVRDTNGNISFNDNNDDEKINAGDTFYVWNEGLDGVDYNYKGYTFVIDTGTDTVRTIL
ncbi:MAG: type IV pilin N-terminal domain-containing protein [Candidatus Thermoplasmatota archaeon]|nr:type IV pilin N-terminal domain-containing protein [Candidatus Thermoplasmatota archaeon]